MKNKKQLPKPYRKYKIVQDLHYPYIKIDFIAKYALDILNTKAILLHNIMVFNFLYIKYKCTVNFF